MQRHPSIPPLPICRRIVINDNVQAFRRLREFAHAISSSAAGRVFCRCEFHFEEAAEGGEAGGDDGDVGFDDEPEAVGAGDVGDPVFRC